MPRSAGARQHFGLPGRLDVHLQPLGLTCLPRLGSRQDARQVWGVRTYELKRLEQDQLNSLCNRLAIWPLTGCVGGLLRWQSDGMCEISNYADVAHLLGLQLRIEGEACVIDDFYSASEL